MSTYAEKVDFIITYKIMRLIKLMWITLEKYYKIKECKK